VAKDSAFALAKSKIEELQPEGAPAGAYGGDSRSESELLLPRNNEQFIDYEDRVKKNV
jgi:hypothetical protein